MKISIDDVIWEEPDELMPISTIDNDSLYAEAIRMLDEFDRGSPISYPQPVSPFRGWLGHILYVVGIKIMDWSQIICWGSRDWYRGRDPNES